MRSSDAFAVTQAARARAEGQVDQLSRELVAARTENAVLQARVAELTQRADIAQNSFEWCRLRLNHIEQERTLLLSHLLKFPVTTVEIARQTPMRTEDPVASIPTLDGITFEDMGDDAARLAGIAHADDGRVIYR
jgi:hypothetical protein